MHLFSYYMHACLINFDFYYFSSSLLEFFENFRKCFFGHINCFPDFPRIHLPPLLTQFCLFLFFNTWSLVCADYIFLAMLFSSEAQRMVNLSGNTFLNNTKSFSSCSSGTDPQECLGSV